MYTTFPVDTLWSLDSEYVFLTSKSLFWPLWWKIPPRYPGIYPRKWTQTSADASDRLLNGKKPTCLSPGLEGSFMQEYWLSYLRDYRGLKKRINAIRKSQQGFDSHVLSSDESPDESAPPRPSDLDSNDLVLGTHFPEPRTSINLAPSTIPNRGITFPEYPANDQASTTEQVQPPLGTSNSMRDRRFSTRSGAFNFTSLRAATRAAQRRSFSSWRRNSLFVSSQTSILTIWTDNGTNGGSQRHPHPLTALPLRELLDHLTLHEVSFFTMLDAQLDKVESFYIAREKEMLDRTYMLQVQLNELNDHRKLFHVRP